MEIVRRSRIKQVVRDLYRAILGREPDPGGARTYESLIRRLGAEKGIPQTLKALMDSEEYCVRTDALVAARLSSVLASQGQQLVNGRPVAHLASLGSFCLPSIIMRNYGLRRYSLPFDWIFSTPQMLRDCLTDDFAVFLDRSYYSSVDYPQQEPAAQHRLYGERYGMQTVFAHHDPTRESDYLHFVRCVTRFRQLLKSDDAKLFLLIARMHHGLANEFPLLLQALADRTKNFVLLCIELLDPTESGVTSIVPVTRSGPHEFHRFSPSAFLAGAGHLPDRFDEWTLLRLLYRYKLCLKDSPWDGVDEPHQPCESPAHTSGQVAEPEHVST